MIRLRVTADTGGTLRSLDKFTEQLEKNMEERLEEVGSFLQVKMTEKIDNWLTPPLKPATIKRKESSQPLIDKGELYAHIDKRMDGKDAIEVGVFGEDEAKIASHHEFGAPKANIPERSFIRSAFNENQRQIKKIIKGK